MSLMTVTQLAPYLIEMELVNVELSDVEETEKEQEENDEKEEEKSLHEAHSDLYLTQGFFKHACALQSMNRPAPSLEIHIPPPEFVRS